MAGLLEQAALELRRLRAELAAAKLGAPEPIAIVGVAARFPGGVRDPEGLWAILRDGKECIDDLGKRWEKTWPEAPLPGNRWAGLIDDIEAFDADFFGMTPREASKLDPQQRLLLEVTWEALERAG